MAPLLSRRAHSIFRANPRALMAPLLSRRAHSTGFFSFPCLETRNDGDKKEFLPSSVNDEAEVKKKERKAKKGKEKKEKKGKEKRGAKMR